MIFSSLFTSNSEKCLECLRQPVSVKNSEQTSLWQKYFVTPKTILITNINICIDRRTVSSAFLWLSFLAWLPSSIYFCNRIWRRDFPYNFSEFLLHMKWKLFKKHILPKNEMFNTGKIWHCKWTFKIFNRDEADPVHIWKRYINSFTFLLCYTIKVTTITKDSQENTQCLINWQFYRVVNCL